MNGYYELKTTAAGKFMFNLKAGNHQVILTSETYDSKSAASNGIASVRTNGPKESSFEKKVSSAGQPYFVLKAGNGETIGKSEMYTSEAARESGIASVIANSPSEKVVEVSA
ncbi:MAG TPA: YegP family protein [Verrucomicrobiales bacterium]|nr:YegP family protein [Verrucomicrobiales bacterium]